LHSASDKPYGRRWVMARCSWLTLGVLGGLVLLAPGPVVNSYLPAQPVPPRDAVARMGQASDIPKQKPAGALPPEQSRATIKGDGKYDKATVFLDNIPFPTGVTVWKKGVLVCAAPDVLYAEDTDGDGKADVVKKVLTGFATHNYQARVNSLHFGLDNWVYGSSGIFGGKIASFTGKTADLSKRDFRFKPDTGEIEPVSGLTQQGRVRDDWGNW